MWTDNHVRSLKPKRNKYRHTENIRQRGVGRLAIEVHPTAVKHFFFQYFRSGKRVLISIGRYRQSTVSSGITLSQAREKAREYGTMLQNGIDVEHYLDEQARKAEEKAKKIEAIKRQGTFDQLMDSYTANMEANGKRSYESVRYSLNLYVKTPFQQLVKRKANEIEAEDIRMILSRMLEKGVTTHTNRVRSFLHAAFQHGLKQDNNPKSYLKDGIKFNLKYNPVMFVPKLTEFEKPGDHVISEEEIKIIWEEFQVTVISELLVKLAFTTGQRLGELVKLRREDIDIDENTLTIPASVAKNGREHIVPLNSLSLEILERAMEVSKECMYLFPAKRTKVYEEDKSTSTATIANKITNFCNENEKVTKFTSRDIRRTVKTLMGKAGISKETRDRIQNHALVDVSARHYDRYDYMKEKMEGMSIWNNYLELVIDSRSNVIRMRKDA